MRVRFVRRPYALSTEGLGLVPERSTRGPPARPPAVGVSSAASEAAEAAEERE